MGKGRRPSPGAAVADRKPRVRVLSFNAAAGGEPLRGGGAGSMRGAGWGGRTVRRPGAQGAPGAQSLRAPGPRAGSAQSPESRNPVPGARRSPESAGTARGR